MKMPRISGENSYIYIFSLKEATNGFVSMSVDGRLNGYVGP
jgi:hypothetical protein